LARASADVLFTPSVVEMYPEGPDQATRIVVPAISEELEGVSRPGHFPGVAAVVCRLFNICHPNIAVFGQKDYQQFVVLQRMVSDLHLPVKLIAGSTARNEDGLALSSRNGYLDAEQQTTALVLPRSLNAIKTALEAGDSDFAALEQRAFEQLTLAGLEPAYVSIREAADLRPPQVGSVRLVVLAAARIAGVRLLDNVLADLPG
jgi:pantoate--beta-alanine ligase